MSGKLIIEPDLFASNDKEINPGRAQPWQFGTYASIDFETTGTDPQRDRFVTVAFVMHNDTQLYAQQGSWHATVDPECGIPKGASDVHGYTTERIATMKAAGELEDTADVIERLLESMHAVTLFGWPVVIFKAPFDLTLLRAESARCGMTPLIDEVKIVDPLVIDKNFNKFRRGKGSRKLTSLCSAYGVFMPGSAHNAFFDCLGAAMLARAMVRKYKILHDCSLDIMMKEQAAWHRTWADGYAAWKESKRIFGEVSREWPIENEARS